jgi:ribosomal protein S18 acetylase RimI-like enzyme
MQDDGRALGTAPLDIRPLDRSSWDALSGLFSQGGDPKWCWCAYFAVRGLAWSNSTAEGNRELLRERMERRPNGHPPGLAAMRGNEAVGWVSVGPRDGYERLTYSKLLAPIDERPVWSIVCFVVGRKARGQGIASALLDGAVEYARANGATTLEAYPVDTSEGRVPAANLYHGTLAMFERAGFEVVAERRFNATSRPRIIVRRELG